MVKCKEGKILVGYHEWAGSLRTQGFPVWVLTSSEELVKIGETIKTPQAYLLPEGAKAVAVIREYVSNSGLRTYYVYPIQEGELQEWMLTEKNNFDVPEAPEIVREILKTVRKVIIREFNLPVD